MSTTLRLHDKSCGSCAPERMPQCDSVSQRDCTLSELINARNADMAFFFSDYEKIKSRIDDEASKLDLSMDIPTKVLLEKELYRRVFLKEPTVQYSIYKDSVTGKWAFEKDGIYGGKYLTSPTGTRIKSRNKVRFNEGNSVFNIGHSILQMGYGNPLTIFNRGYIVYDRDYIPSFGPDTFNEIKVLIDAEDDEYIMSLCTVFDERFVAYDDKEIKKCRVNVIINPSPTDSSLSFKSIKMDDFKTDVKDNYNDDLPYERLLDILERDRQDLILLYGEPGTGKTSLIKSIMRDCDTREFYVMDYRILQSVGDKAFFNFCVNNDGAVFILEDCENLLKDRMRSSFGQNLSTLLDLTDGICGSLLKIKFICTFNTDLKNVDKALLRKGRLSLAYEFKPLSLEKTKKLLPEATKPMTLADIYNAKEENGIECNGRGRIGF